MDIFVPTSEIPRFMVPDLPVEVHHVGQLPIDDVIKLAQALGPGVSVSHHLIIDNDGHSEMWTFTPATQEDMR